MRSHAKASSAGSNLGGGATRGPVLATLVLCLCAAACLLPGSALAALTRQPLESFGSDGTAASTFESPSALAFDQGNKHLFALDASASKIYGFDASAPATYSPLGGNFPLAVSGGGLIPDLAADSASHWIYYSSTETASLYGFDATGSPLGANFPIEGLSTPCGATVDSAGNVWVGQFSAQTVGQYDSSGSLVKSVDISAQGNPCHVALDSQENLYVSMFQGGTWKYTAASGYTAASPIDSLPGEGNSNPIALDRASDELYVVHPNHVSVYDRSGNPLYEFGASVAGAQYNGITIDQGTDVVYVSDAAHGKVEVFGPPVSVPTVSTEDADALTTSTATLHGTVDPEGSQLSDCHFEYVTEAAFKATGYTDLSSGGSAPCVPAAASIPPDSTGHAVKAEISALGTNTSYRFRLLATSAKGTTIGAERVLTTATGVPLIGAAAVEAIGNADATLSAKINPQGAPTTYHVEYGTTAAYGQSTPESAPIGFPGDDSDHTVSVHIGGLSPGTAYHFRFVATSLVGKAEGPDTTFATFPAGSSPGACPNSQLRTGFGLRLSDCRAYEQVTPTDKHGANVEGQIGDLQASVLGDRVTFYLRGGLATTGGSSTLSPFMASRGPAGWSTDGLIPLVEPGLVAYVVGWSEDLATTFDEGGVPGGNAFYLRDSDSAAYQPLFSTATKVTEARFGGFAADTSHLTFESNGQLLPDAAAGRENLYDLNHGTLTLPGRIPASPATSCDDESSPACVPAPEGAFEGKGIAAYNSISRDGSKVFFTDRASGELYVREGATRTTLVSASQKTDGPGPGGSDPLGPKPAAFRQATPDGAHAYFTSAEELTDDADTGVGPGIGRADIDGTGANQSFVPLPEAADGVAVDGSHVYWANPAAGTIGRANLDGSGVEQSFIGGASKPQYVAVDGAHIYWTDAASGADGAGTIGRANLDGTGVDQSFISGASNPQGIALDAAHIYWANAGSSEATRAIARANLDGTSPEQSFVAVEGESGPVGVAVNASFLYWTNPSAGFNSIGRVTIAGESPQQRFVPDLNNPRGLALDGSYLYWANSTIFVGFGSRVSSAIGRVRLDGSEREKSFLQNNDAQGVAVDAAHIYWAGADARDTGADLYRYDSGSADLNDLTASTGAANPRGADVQGFVGATPDGSYVYFVANGVLAPGAPPGGIVVSKEGNFIERTDLYLSHAGRTEFVAQLASSKDETNYQVSSRAKTSRVAADGTLVFSSESLVDLSGHDHGNKCEGPCTEYYRYTPADGETLCVTCTPTGTPPSRDIELGSPADFAGAEFLNPPSATMLPRNLSADGNHFFFESVDPLLPSDTNGVNDVYEWEARGSGSCESENQNGGCLYLISSGTSPIKSRFADASADGDHVFFFTDQQLVPGDQDQLTDIYDAAVDGGLASQHQLAPPTCSSTACQANPAPPPDPSLSSSSYRGTGNLHTGAKGRNCPKGKRKVRHGGKARCQKAHKAKQHKRHNNRGGSK